jgi:hypothetical protein
MLSKADDYPIHQSSEPIAYAGTTDRNFYDRYFFNGYTKDGELFFAAAMGIYPHLNIIDASFCIVRQGKQYNLHASRVLGMERMDTFVGPISIEVVEPLKKLRIKVADNEYRVKADLVFTMRTAPIEEPRFVYRQGPRTTMDYTRLTQNGTYEGWIEADGQRAEIKPSRVWGTRDRSWGVRPIGAADPQGVSPPRAPQFYWLWAPCNFEDRFTLYHNNAEASGAPWNQAAVMGALEDPHPEHTRACSSAVIYKPGTRHAKSCVVELGRFYGENWTLTLEPQWEFYMAGLGYMNPEWGHGAYKGQDEIGFELFELGLEDENRFDRLHVQAFSKAILESDGGSRHTGSGVLEQLVIGPHEPSGFKELLDLAP